MKLYSLTRLLTKIKKDRHFIDAYLFYISLAILLLSCSNKVKRITYVKDIVFKTSVGTNYPSIYYDNELQKEIIYFCDLVEAKSIKFFTTNGVLLRTTPLIEIIKNIDNVGGVTVIAADTIVINSNYTNEILIADRSGKVWKTYSLKNRLIDSLGNRFEILSAVYPVIQNVNSLVFGLNWRDNLNDIRAKEVPQGNIEYLKYFNKKYLEGAYLINIENILSAQPRVKFKCYGLFKGELDSNSVVTEQPSFFPLGESIFVSSFYSDRIVKINENFFKPEGIIKLSSDYTSLGANSIKITKSTIGKIQDSLTYKQKTCGYIERMFFNKPKQEYYVLVRYNVSTKAFDRDTIPFSIIILNKNLTKKSEISFEGSKYKYYYTLLSSSDGLLLFKNDTSRNLIKDEKVTYTLFNLH